MRCSQFLRLSDLGLEKSSNVTCRDSTSISEQSLYHITRRSTKCVEVVFKISTEFGAQVTPGGVFEQCKSLAVNKILCHILAHSLNYRVDVKPTSLQWKTITMCQCATIQIFDKKEPFQVSIKATHTKLFDAVSKQPCTLRLIVHTTEIQCNQENCEAYRCFSTEAQP